MSRAKMKKLLRVVFKQKKGFFPDTTFWQILEFYRDFLIRMNKRRRRGLHRAAPRIELPDIFKTCGENRFD